jgi:hypothetical protein
MQNLKHSLKIAALPLFLAASAVNAAGSTPNLTDQTDLTTGLAEIILPNITPNDAGEGIRKAISQFAIPATLSYRPIANSTPARPGQPSTVQVEVLGTPARAYVCDGGFAELRKKPAPTTNAFIQVAEGTQVCLYNFKGGVKAYVVFNRIVRSESLTAGLFKGITTAIQGKDEDRIAKELKWNVDEIKKIFPTALVQRVSIPGKPVEEPDMEAVAKILPADEPQAIPAQAAAPSAAPTAQHAAPQAAQAPAGSVQAKVNARKDLNAMGLSYHSAEQFHQAVARKDDVAVSLFLAGGGVEPSTADANGVSALALAERTGAQEIVAMLKNHEAMKAAPTIQATSAAPATPSPVASQSIAQGQPLPSIPPELKAKIDQQIDAMPLSPEQKDAQRAAQYLNVQKVLRSVDSIKAASSQ